MLSECAVRAIATGVAAHLHLKPVANEVIQRGRITCASLAISICLLVARRTYSSERIRSPTQMPPL